ncbi:MAG: TonB-dependent receptor, partial [Eudoraea sp.]|nr:TonB-dependent receptor [Eudoraea sp.]
MKQHYLVILVLVFGAIGIANGQISGTVTDDQGVPLVGASVVKKGTSVGTTTDFDGKFIIDAILGDRLMVSFIGYEPLEVLVNSTIMNITLVSGLELSEVIITGSRNPNRVATESTVPVDVIDVKELASVGPQVNLNQILNYVAPSFTSNTQTISDGTDHID